MRGLCNNPDCTAFFEVGADPVLCRDRETRQNVLLCEDCARWASPSGRYTKVEAEESNEKERVNVRKQSAG